MAAHPVNLQEDGTLAAKLAFAPRATKELTHAGKQHLSFCHQWEQQKNTGLSETSGLKDQEVANATVIPLGLWLTTGNAPTTCKELGQSMEESTLNHLAPTNQWSA